MRPNRETSTEPIVAIVSTIIAGQPVNKLKVELVNYQLFQPVTIAYSYLNNGAVVVTGRLQLTPDQISAWGADDHTLIDIVINILGLTKI